MPTPLEYVMERLRPLVERAIANTKKYQNRTVDIKLDMWQGEPNIEIKAVETISLPLLNLETGVEASTATVRRDDCYEEAIKRIQIDVERLLLERREVRGKSNICLRFREGAYMAVEEQGSEPRYVSNKPNNSPGQVSVKGHKVVVR